MSRFDPYLKTYAESKDGNGLLTEIADVWQSIRGTNLYSGGPRGTQTDEAMARSISALRLASQTNNRMLLAEACRLMAHALNADEQYEQSVEYYQKAIALFESSGSGEQAARTRLGFMAALCMMGKYDQSLEIAAEAEQWFQAHNHLSGLAKVYTNIGNLSSRRQEYQVALQYHSKARILFERLKDWPALAMCYQNLANGLAFTDQLDDAAKMYDLCAEICSQLNMQQLFMQAQYNRSYLMFLQGHYAESLEAFRTVKEYFLKTGSRHHVNLCDLDVAEVYLHLHKPAEALSYSKAAVAGFSKTPMRYEHSKALAFSAMALAQLDRLEEAEKAASTAREMFETEGNRYWISITDFCLAYLRMARGDVAKARLLAAQAKLQFQEMAIKTGTMDSLTRLGAMGLDSGHKTAASCMTEVLKLTINKRR
jgi:tetratricopeptide (TPR) repeat protein